MRFSIYRPFHISNPGSTVLSLEPLSIQEHWNLRLNIQAAKTASMVAHRKYQVKKGSRLAFEVKSTFVDDDESGGQSPGFCQDWPIPSDLKCEDEDRDNAAIPMIFSDTKDSRVEGGNRTGFNTGVEDGTHYGRQNPDSHFYDAHQRRPGLATTSRWPREDLHPPRNPADDLIDYNTERQFSTFTQFWCIVAMHGSTSTWGTPTGEFNMRHNEQDLWRCVSSSSNTPCSLSS